ncbi:MAG: ATP-binding protein, partial [Lentilitoribacter sp.]
KLDDDATELLAMCSTTVDRMKSLVEYVLDYTRIVTLATDKAEISLNQVVASAMKKLQPEITARNAEVSIGQLPNILAIPQQMEIFMQCLLSNAIKYCPIERIPEIQIFAEIKPERDLCSITVKDNGIGIAPINHDRIFTLFQRLHGHNEIQGSGIGLTMCKRIALNHEGQIDLVSSPGMGAAFTLCLPMRVLQGSE